MSRGELRLYLSAVPGAGATYAMLDEGRRRRDRGARVVVGCVDTHGRPATDAVLEEIADSIVGEGTSLDVDLILSQHPQVVLVDDVATVDMIGGRATARWKEVGGLLDAGLDVVGTIRMDQIESLAEKTSAITRSRYPTPVPDAFLRRASQIQLVDITPAAIRRRIAHGNVFSPDELDPETSDLFNSSRFERLRALLFAWMAERTAQEIEDDSSIGSSPTGWSDAHIDRRRESRLSPPSISVRRRMWALTGGFATMLSLTVVLVSLRDQVSVSTGLALYLLTVVASSAAGGWIPGLATGLAAPLLANWFLIEPYHTLRINYAEDAVELVVFLSVAVIVSAFVSIASRRAREAEESRREASTLATLAGSAGPDPLDSITQQLLGAFGFDGVAVFSLVEGKLQMLSSAGATPPTDPYSSSFCEVVADGILLAASGRTLTADDHRVLQAFVRQLGRAVEQQRLARLSAEAVAIGRADELRTAILRAVSHDLRSPLANIKVAVSSLRQDDIEWTRQERSEFLEQIEQESDRLTEIITNLLDMSRLDAGAITPQMRMVSLEEIVPSAVHRLGSSRSRVDVQIPETLPYVYADPALLDRVVSNLLVNALEWSPPDTKVRVIGHERADDVQVYVVDHGPGIHPRDRESVTRPFHRLSDSGRPGGLGLGLAIAHGLTSAMGGTLELRDTARGGLTVVVTLCRSVSPDDSGSA